MPRGGGEGMRTHPAQVTRKFPLSPAMRYPDVVRMQLVMAVRGSSISSLLRKYATPEYEPVACCKHPR